MVAPLCSSTLIFFVVLLQFTAKTSSCVFNIRSYGAVRDGHTNNKKALLAAWDGACAKINPSTLIVPVGVFLVTEVEFSGPCKSAITFRQEGILKAPQETSITSKFWIEFLNLYNLTVDGVDKGILDGNGRKSWNHLGCRSHGKCSLYPATLRLNNISEGIIANIEIRNSKSFHLTVFDSHDIKIQHVGILSPADSPNTDGIHISQSSNINISSSIIGVGDDCISIGPGAKQTFISNITCGSDHGISVGSLGKYENEEDVADLTVRNCTMNATDNGVRIKTWSSLKASKATNFRFEDIIMINVSNPVIIDQEYCPGHDCSSTGSHVQVKDITYKNIKGTSNTESAVTLVCSPVVPCQNISLIDINLTQLNGKTVSKCSNAHGVATGKQNPPPSF